MSTTEPKRAVRLDIHDNGKLVLTWELCGHEVVINGPHTGHWMAIGNADPCPICEGGDMPRESEEQWTFLCEVDG